MGDSRFIVQKSPRTIPGFLIVNEVDCRILKLLKSGGILGVISPLIWVISIVTLLITLCITTHEPPSRGLIWSF